ncbi:sulfite exporter TauE/SafE family protein [Cupriavidus sp. 2TAF22]|uniref:sulfite exporter TauE/SafE family protein n=1 Tax=unclassified Cupriavidus TaxID=2640874 RepID=UPI003F91CCB3
MLTEFLLSQTHLSLFQLACLVPIVIWAYTIFGLTGFGSSIMAMPLLTQIVPLRTAVPMILFFDLVAGTLLGLRSRRQVNTAELRRLVPGVLAGMACGLALLMHAPERPLLLVLGLFVLLHSAWSLLFKRGYSELDPRLSVPFGLAGGVLTALFGTGGPVYTIYLAGRLRDPGQLRATTSTLIVLTAFARLAMFAAAGLYANTAIFVLAAVLMPCAIAGYLAGGWLHRRIAPAKVIHAVWGVLVMAGLGLVYRSALG